MYQESDETFEILDYTTATDLERFISDFENILKQWNLCPGTLNSTLPTKQPNNQLIDFLSFRNVSFLISYHESTFGADNKVETELDPERVEEETSGAKQLIERLQDDSGDFQAEAADHPLHYLYGIHKFVAVQPDDVRDVIATEDTVKMLLSAVTIAVNSIGCSCPIFIKSGESERNLFQGVFIDSAIKFSFEMVQFRSFPGLMGSLLEISDMFKEKIGNPRNVPIMVNAKFTFEQNKFVEPFKSDWLVKPSTNFDALNFALEAEWFRNFVFAPTVEPIDHVSMSLMWCRTRPTILKDSIYFSNYETLTPSRSELKIKVRPEIESPYLFTLKIMFDQANKTDNDLHPLISFKLRDCTQVDAKSALERITQRDSLDISFVELDEGHLDIDQEFRNQLLNFLFASDADDSLQSDDFSLKTCPPNSLTWRFGLLVAHLFFRYREWKVISIMWRDLTSQLRRFWESGEFIPDVESVANPEFKFGHLHQALQMLNCCIAAKRQKQQNWLDQESHADEFYDCDVSEEEEDFCDTVEDSKHWNVPEGVLREHDTLELLHSGVKLNIPITQEAAPMTEEMLEEQAQILLKGQGKIDHNESSAVRSQLHCAVLLSDMEAFKAANPEGCFEDFVRWYSPNDYISNDSSLDKKDGCLSPRFASKDNLWFQLWTSAKVEPVAKQKLLFDYTKVAESVLHKFDMLTGSRLLQYALPVFSHILLVQTKRKAGDLKAGYDDELNECRKQLQDKLIINDFRYLLSPWCSSLASLERRIFTIESLQRKLKSTAQERIADYQTVLQSPETAVILKQLAEEESVEFKPNQQSQLFELFRSLVTRNESSNGPCRKEFYLRTTCPRPSTFSRDLFQMMHCTVSSEGLRLNGCFLEDIVYY
jgi:Rab3 GTPase-activating protein catalytic subunit